MPRNRERPAASMRAFAGPDTSNCTWAEMRLFRSTADKNIMEPHYLVAGDLHTERAQYGLSIRYEDNQRCIEAILQEACSNPGCLGLILTGDTFHRKSLLPKYQIRLQNLAQRLHQAGKKFFAIDGNHDGSDASWLDTVGPEINANGRVLKLGPVSAAFLSYQPRERLYEKIKQLPNDTTVLLVHGRILELMAWAAHQQEPEYDFSAKELRELGLKNCTVFMGDLHTYSDYHDPVADNWFIYSGSTEMTEISEGNVISDRFGPRYDTVKKCLRFYPGREHGRNWEVMDLPSRPFLKRIIGPEEDPDLAVQSVNQWVESHPEGILALHYPQKLRAALKPHLGAWRQKLLVFFEVPLSEGMARPLQEMKETDILEIAQKELTARQVQILTLVLTQEPFDKPLADLMKVPATAI